MVNIDPEGLLDFLRLHRLAVQASVSARGVPQAAVVGIGVTNRFEIVFDTLASTRKVKNLRANPKIALVIGGLLPGDERSVQYEGIADVPEGAELARVLPAYYASHPGGRTRARRPGVIYIRVRPTWLRYCDYNQNPPVIVEFHGEDFDGLAG